MSSDEHWKQNAVNWIKTDVAAIPEFPVADWCVARPTPQAVESVLAVIDATPADCVCRGLGATQDRGFSMEWINDRKALDIDILSDGSFEIARLVDDRELSVTYLPAKRISALGEAFAWLAS